MPHKDNRHCKTQSAEAIQNAKMDRRVALRTPRDDEYKTFKALGILLWYPDAEWLQGASDLCDLIEREKLVGADDVKAIRAFTDGLKTEDLFAAQEDYVDTFDRVRSLSLHLFEHVHGDSRDRGQAMVDLAERYKELGFSLAASELPDYLPVFLEYLSMLPKEEALEELANTGHILSAIGKRLAERENPYSAVFNCLTRLAGLEPEKMVQKIKVVPLSFAELDQEWEDKPIDFMGAEAPKAGGCGSGGCGGGCKPSLRAERSNPAYQNWIAASPTAPRNDESMENRT